MAFALIPHPEVGPGAADAVSVAVQRPDPGTVTLAWSLTGDLGRVALPHLGSLHRGHGLWKHTCFEMFVQAADGGYYEFNLSPSRAWAAYRFSGYRVGMADVEGAPVASLGSRAEAGMLELVATLDLSALAGLNLQKTLRAGFSAIIEGDDGERSFWALAHAPGEPDFHNPAAFAARI